MRTKSKLVNKTKLRVRFLSLDFYRTLVTGICTKIIGIKSYYCNENMIRVYYDDGFQQTYFVNEGETQLKQVIKQINAHLGGK